MKHLFILFLFGSATMASAQLVNGSFEDGLAGWSPTMFDPGTIVADPAPGGGTESVSLLSKLWINPSPHNLLFHPLPDIVDGQTVQFSGWMKPHAYSSDHLPGVGIGYLYAPNGIAVLCTIGSSSPADMWTYSEGLCEISGVYPVGSMICFVLDPGDYAAEPTMYPTVLFDGLDVAVTTTVSEEAYSRASPTQHPAFRPNPATDKLWVDLPETPISLTCIDATGRAQALKNFQHTNRTLELDVSALPSGVNMLRIMTTSGNHVIRFIKA
jgi:hypothetical protein